MLVSKIPKTDINIKKIKGAEVIYITCPTKSKKYKTLVDLTNYVLLDTQRNGNRITRIYIRHPFLSRYFNVEYIEDNLYFDYGKDLIAFSDQSIGQITATLYEKDGEVIAYSGNGAVYHKKNGCERVRLNVPTGQRYDLCDGCNPKNHSEAVAIKRAKTYNKLKWLKNANAYLYGHWWSCKDCSVVLEKTGIKNLYMSKDWTKKFLEI